MFKLCAALAVVMAFACPALANEQAPYKGEGVFCDTLAAARDFMATYEDGDPGPALAAVNSRSKSPDDCGVALLYVMDSQSYDTITRKDGVWRFIEVEVVALIEPRGPINVVTPMRTKVLLYTARIETEAAPAGCSTSEAGCI